MKFTITYINKNVDIEFSVHNFFLEYPPSGTLKMERLENQIIKVLVAGVTKSKYHHVLLYLETQFQQIVNFTKLSTVLSGRLLLYLTVKDIHVCPR
jgi:hypothetical protein